MQPRVPNVSEDVPEVLVTGTISSVRFASDKSTFAVLSVRPSKSDEPITVIGELQGFQEGELVRFSGRWEAHPTYGKRFRALSWVPLMPSSDDGLVRYLGSGLVPGIGERIAERIVARFGQDALDVITTQRKRLTEIEGIGRKRADALSEVIQGKRAEAEGIAFLHGLGLGPALAKKIHARFGTRTAEQMRLDPYRTAEEIPGIGFLTADKIGRGAGIADHDPRRAEGAVLHVVGRAADEGHVMLPVREVLARAVALSVPEANVVPAIEALRAREMLMVEGIAHGIAEGDAVYAPPLFRAEKKVASVLTRLASEAGALGEEEAKAALAAVDLSQLHPTQRLVVERALHKKLVVLTGGPGTGKTTTVRAILAALEAAKLSVGLAAPTGRAAKRLAETTKSEAKTLHRLLEWTPGMNAFARNQNEPLELDVVLVDEASMLDVRLAASLLDALAPKTHLILVGDVDQLPPVGAGQVLRALIASGVAEVVRLTQVFRQAEASAIVRGAHALLRGQVPTPTPPKTKGTGDLFLVTADDGDEAPALLVRVLRRMAQSYGLDVVNDVQVLSPMKKGAFGVDRLNEVLQAELNPQARSRPARQRFAVGDKVMQTVNDYEREVYNGDLGRVVRVEAQITYVNFGGVSTSYKDDELDPLVLAYAATIHKAQGSEFPAVVVVLHGSHHVMLSRALVYTALTRAQKLVVLFGDAGAVRRAAQNDRTQLSYTLLEHRLRKAPDRT